MKFNAKGEEVIVFSTTAVGAAVDFSAGTSSGNLSSLVFADSNGVSFGLSGSTITASAAGGTAGAGPSLSAGTQIATSGTVLFSNSGGVTFGMSNSSIITAAISAIKGLGASNTGNTSGNTGVSTGVDWVLAGTQNITVSQSTAVGGPNTLWVSGPVVGGLQTGISCIQVSDATYTSGTVTFRNANGISFGSSGANGISASYTVPTQSNQTIGAYAVSNTTGQSSSSTFDARTLSLHGGGIVSVGYSGGSIIVSAPTNFLTTAALSNHSHGNPQLNLTNLSGTTASASNGFTLSLSAAATVAQTNQTGGVYFVGNTTGQSSSSTYDLRTLSFDGAGIVSAGWSNGTVRISATQSNQAFSADASSTFQTLTFQDSNGISFSNNAGAIRLTHGLQFTSGTSAITSNALNTSASRVINILAATNNTGGGTASLSSNVSFSNANGLTFYTSAGNAVVASYTVPSTTQFLTTAALSDHSHGNPTLALTNLTGTTASASNGFTLSLSAAAPGGGGSIVVSAGTTNTSFSNFSLANSNGVSFGVNASTITGSIASYSLIFQNANNHTFGTSTNGSTTSVTVSYQPPYVSSYENVVPFASNITLTHNGVSISHAVAFNLPYDISCSFIRIPMVATAASTSRTITAASANASVERYSTFNAVVYSLGVGASSRSLMSVTSSSVGWTFRNSMSQGAAGTSGSYTQGFSCAAAGQGTTLTTQYTVANANSYQFSSTAFSDFSGSRFLDIHWANSLSAGAYWLIFGYSSSSTANSTVVSAASVCGVGYSNHYGASQADIAFGVMGSTNLTSGGALGAGSFSTAGGGTTANLPISAISSWASNVRPYFQMLRSA